MTKGSSGAYGTLIGVLAIVAGILVLLNLVSISIIVGIFLIVFGVVSLIRR